MSTSIIQLVDELPKDNITVKVLNALDFIAPGQWDNIVGFDENITEITGETNAKIVRRIRDRAASLYLDPDKGYQDAIGLYQAIDKADVAMATAALANKIGEKISFLSFLGNITPKADTTQTIDLLLKIAVEAIAFCKLNGIPQPNPQQFATALAENYQGAGFMRMVALVCIDGILPLGPDFLGKIHEIVRGIDAEVITKNPVFLGVKDKLPGDTTSDRVGFLNQCFEAVEVWMKGFVEKTGITPPIISDRLGQFVQIADDNLDFVAAVLDQMTNYYEHTGIQSVARCLILDAYELVKEDLKNTPEDTEKDEIEFGENPEFSVGDTIEVWDKNEEDWYEATIRQIKVKKGKNRYFVHYVGYGTSEDEWVKEKNVRSRDRIDVDENGYAIDQKVQVWDDDEEEWYAAIIQKIDGDQYRVHYIGEDDSYDEWVDLDEMN